MTPVDRDILELLHNGEEQELALNGTMIAENIDWKAQTVREHLVTLRNHDMVKYRDKDRAVHVLTDRGRAFVEGDDDPESDEFDDGE